MIEINQLHKIAEAIGQYKCDQPLHHYLKSYFLQHRNMGARDRRTMRIFVYNYFRLGKAFSPSLSFRGRGLNHLSVEEKISVASFLILNNKVTLADFCISNFTPLNIENISLSLDEKIKIIKNSYPE